MSPAGVGAPRLGPAVEPLPLRRRFGFRLLLWMLLAAVVPASVAGWVSTSLAQETLLRELRARLLGVAEDKASRLDAWATSRRNAVTAMARGAELGTLLADADAHRAELSRAVLGLGAQARTLGFRNVLLADARGQVLASSEPTHLAGRTLREAELARTEVGRAFDRALLLAETEFSDFSLEPLTRGSTGPHALVAAPVAREGRVVGVLVGELDNDEVLRVSADLRGLGATGEVQLLGFVGGRALFVAPTRSDRGAAFHRQALTESDSVTGLALRGARGDGLRTDARGVRVFAVWRYLPSLRWGLVTQLDEAEAFAPARRLRWLSLALTTAAAALAAGLAFLISRRVSEPVGALTRETALIAEGDLSRHVAVQSTDELGQLARVFNHMVEELRRHTEGLEQQVAERTKELTEKGRRIQESIDLATQIQGSLLPDLTNLPPSLRSVGLLWRPLDGVGGDLAFLEPTGDGGFVAGVIDCTGHGVAAAMTAMFASAMCSLAIATHGAQGPAAVLRELDRRLERAFERARGEGIALGMDVGLVAATPGQPVRFAGAGIGLVVRSRDGELEELTGRRKGLGYGSKRGEKPMPEHALPAEELHTLYLFSDGIIDEPVTDSGESLGRKRLFELLRALDAADTAGSLEALDASVREKRGARRQRDDVTLLALAVEPAGLAQRKEVA